MLSGCHHPIGGQGSSQGAGAEALKVGLQLITFPLMVAPPPTSLAHLPKRGAVMEEDVLEQALGVGWSAHWCSPGLPVRAPEHLWSATPTNASNGLPCSVQMLCWSGPALSPQLLPHPSTGSPCPSRSCPGARGNQVGIWPGLSSTLGLSQERDQSPGRFQAASSTFFLEVSKHARTSQEQSLRFWNFSSTGFQTS